MAMQVTLTKPIEDFIHRQLSKGYPDVSEVMRQAFLRWMEEEEVEADPPHLREKLAAAHDGTFRPYKPELYDSLITAPDEGTR
jgi:putative addiction module CopG family antidote